MSGCFGSSAYDRHISRAVDDYCEDRVLIDRGERDTLEQARKQSIEALGTILRWTQEPGTTMDAIRHLAAATLESME